MAYSSLRNARLPTSNYIDERYQLNGMNISTPDELIRNGEAALALNCRMYAREKDDRRVAIKTRKGPGFYTIPLGESLDQQQISPQDDIGPEFNSFEFNANVLNAAGQQIFNKTDWIAQSFTSTQDKRLTRIDINLRKNTGTGTVLVDIYTDVAGSPGVLLSTSGIAGSAVPISYAYTTFRFINPPLLTNSTVYWIVVRAQDENVNFYSVTTTDNTTDAKVSSNGGGTWTDAAWSMNFKEYPSTDGPALGGTRRYGFNGVNETIFAHGTSLYKVDDLTGATTVLKTGLNVSATNYRYAMYNDKTIIVNGYDTAMQYDGTAVTNLSGLPFTPNNVIAHKNRLYFTTSADPTRVFFSDLTDEQSYPSINFFYVPNPKSSDPIIGWVIFQDNLVIFTKESKYVYIGDGTLSGSALRQSIGTKGAVKQEALAADRNFVYFVSDDAIYRWNGSTDQTISDKIQPEFDNIANLNKTSVGVWNNQLRVYYPGGGSPTVNKMLLFDLIYSQWFVDDTAYYQTPVYLSQDLGNPLIEFSSIVGAIYYAEQAFSALGAPYYFKYWTCYNKYLSGSSKDRIRVFRPFIRPSGYTYIMQIGKDIDFKNVAEMQPYTVTSLGAVWGSGLNHWGDGIVTWGSSSLSDNKASMSGRGKHTQYRFERFGANTPVELYGYLALVKSGRIQ